MHWINDYICCPYVDGGRDLNGLDCWGLIRDVLQKHYGTPVLGSFGNVTAADKKGMTLGFKQVVQAFTPSPPQAASVAAGFRGENLIHVGVCVDVNGGLKVLHTSSKHGPSLDTLAHFQRLFPKVIFYEYSNNSGVSQQTRP